MTFQMDSQQRMVRAADLVRWGGRVDIRGGTVVVMADGGLLVAHAASVDRGQVQALSDLWGETHWPMRQTRGVVLQAPTAQRPFDRLIQRMLFAERQEDQLWLENGDTIDGNLIALDNQHVVIRTQTVDATVPTERVRVVFLRTENATSPAPGKLYCVAGFRDGTVIRATRMILSDGRLDATTVGGVRLSTDPLIDARTQLVSLQTIGGGAMYLSDLQPLGYRHIPYLMLGQPLGIDRNTDGSQLRATGVIYDKGLGMHSASRVAYQLSGQYRWFAAQLALDDQVADGGSVVFRVYVDRRQAPWRRVYESRVLRGGDDPLPISIDIRQAERLALIVDFADRVDQQDHANWLDARVVK